MVTKVDRRTFLTATAGAGGAVAGCFTDSESDSLGELLPGDGGGTVPTTEDEIGFYVLDADESFADVEPDESKAIAWHPDKGRRTWGF